MAILYDARGNEFVGQLDIIAGTTNTDARAQTAILSAVNAEVDWDTNGHATLALDLRTAAASMTVVFEASIDGTNFFGLPAFNTTTSAYVASVVVTTTLTTQYLIEVEGFKRMRVRVSAYTSGTLTVAGRATIADVIINTEEIPSIALSATGAAAAAVTLTLPAPGAGLRHYITGLEITRNSTAALAGTATLVITTTNLPGSLAWSVGNAMAAGGTQIDVQREFVHPLQSAAQNTATTIVAPAPGAAVLWRLNAYYYLAP
jgi:hypothetical protein